MTNYFGGNHVTQYGNHNIGMQFGDKIDTVDGNTLTEDQRYLLQEAADAVRTLRDRVDPADRQQIDESLTAIAGDDVRWPTLRRALADVAGIAAVVGQIGAPVIEAVRKVMGAFAS